jgi:tRNA pseudouridine38-40 synthase
MRTLKLTLAYDGTNYVGWQRQQNGVSIQQLVEEAFQPFTGRDGPGPTVVGAGRTDAGVHALAQIASVTTDIVLTVGSVHRALNVRLPADIRVLAVEDARPGFHAQFHATGKVYRYRIATSAVLSPFDRWFVWHRPGARDLDGMRRAARLLAGREHGPSGRSSGSGRPAWPPDVRSRG